MFIQYDSNVTINNLQCRHLGIYKVYSTVDTTDEKSNTTTIISLYIQKLHKDDYIILNTLSKNDNHYTAITLEAQIQRFMDNGFKDNPYPNVILEYIAKTRAEYQNIIKSEHAEFTAEFHIANLADRIYIIRGTRRKNVNPPILFIKRNGNCYIINREYSDWYEEKCTIKKLVAMADLMFGQCFDIKQIKI